MADVLDCLIYTRMSKDKLGDAHGVENQFRDVGVQVTGISAVISIGLHAAVMLPWCRGRGAVRPRLTAGGGGWG